MSDSPNADGERESPASTSVRQRPERATSTRKSKRPRVNIVID